MIFPSETATKDFDYHYLEFSADLNVLTSSQGVEEADRAKEGFYIRSGITIIPKNATIKDGTVI